MQSLIRGALAGVAATVPMTAVIAAGDVLGLLRTPPPEEITARVAERAGEVPDRQSPAFQAEWLAAHTAYGAACGAVYALARPLLPRSDVLAGLLFGGAVWGVSYIGLLPALALYPAPDEDAPGRAATMIAAHAVYGTALAATARRLRANGV
jgi:hypothetical protein